VTRRIKLIDVARDAGVSPATVSRAIAQPEIVSREMLARVRASAQRLGYVPDGAARALASGRSMTIGAVVPTLDSAIFARGLQSMQTTLAQEGYLLLVASHEGNAAAEAQAVTTLLGRGVDGLMLVGAQRAHGTAEVLSAVLRQPLIRSSNLNLSAALTLERTQLRDKVDVSSIATDRTMHDANLSLVGERTDAWGGGGVTLAQVGVLAGRVGFDNEAAQDGDAASAQTEGGFTKWTLNLSRQQSVGANGTLSLSMRGQWANCNLDASQKLSVGGPFGVRGYDTGVAPGDEGEIFSAEYRHTVRMSAPGVWQASVFADTAHVRINAKPFSGGDNNLHLSGAGMGLSWTGLDGWQANVAVAAPIGSVPNSLDYSRTTRGWVDIRRQF